MLRGLRWWRLQQEEEKGGDDEGTKDDGRESAGHRATAELQQNQGEGEKAD